MIKHYITNICKPIKSENKVTFYGDGEGDFEDSSLETTVDCLERYIARCLDQIEIARTVLKQKQQ